MARIKLYFNDFFECTEKALADHGALNVSLVADLPLFIDPFLIFNSKRPEYQALHAEMIKYVQFLQDNAGGTLPDGLMRSWYCFGEVKQNWLGWSVSGNDGRGLGPKFARALHSNLGTILKIDPVRQLTKGRHIEKLCLIQAGVGRDNISDFTTNLIKHFLLEYTENFATNIEPKFRKTLPVERAAFNYETETWETRTYSLPWFDGNYVLLTPEDMLTKDDTWISQAGLVHRFNHIVSSVPNPQLRWQLDNYFRSKIPTKKRGERISREEKSGAVIETAKAYPELLDWYIKDREERSNEATEESFEKVDQTKEVFIKQVRRLADLLEAEGFYKLSERDSFKAAQGRVQYLKQCIEANDGYRLFYVNGNPIEREADLQLIFRLTWYASPFEVDAEPNNGRGPVDYKISKGSADKALVEFKLASNSKLEQNLAKQVEVYKKANRADKALKVVIFFTLQEQKKVERVLKRLEIDNDPNVVLIDARKDNKISASKRSISAESDPMNHLALSVSRGYIACRP